MQSSRHQSRCCHTIADSQWLFDLKKEECHKFRRRMVDLAVRQRVVTRTAVRTPVAEVKNRRTLPRTSNIRFDVKKGSRCDPDTKPGKGNWSVGRNTKGHEEKTVPRVQHNVLGFRNDRKTAIGVQSRSKRRLRQFLDVH